MKKKKISHKAVVEYKARVLASCNFYLSQINANKCLVNLITQIFLQNTVHFMLKVSFT